MAKEEIPETAQPAEADSPKVEALAILLVLMIMVLLAALAIAR